MDFLFCVLTEEPSVADFEEFFNQVATLMNILVRRPDWKVIRPVTEQLWMGEMTWREFISSMMEDHLQDNRHATHRTSEKSGKLHFLY